jgi:hypothetical protein
MVENSFRDPGGRRQMPERKEARDRAQATVDAAAVSVQALPDMTGGDRSILVSVSPETWAALEIIAQGRALEALVAEAIEDYLRKKRTPPTPA